MPRGRLSVRQQRKFRAPDPSLPAAPEPGHYTEIAGGILWLRLPLQGPLAHINVWLVPSARGWTLVDTGICEPDVTEAWRKLDAELDLRARLESIVVTHHHPDHMGMARALAERYAVPVHMSDRAHACALDTASPMDAGARSAMQDFGRHYGVDFDAGLAGILDGEAYRRIISGVPEEVQRLEEGQVFATQYADWSVSIHEGHAAGHACLHAPGRSVLISGDAVLPFVSSNVSLVPANAAENPLGDFLASLARLGELPQGTLVLPAHGPPFRYLHERLTEITTEHELRLGEIEAACTTPQSTAAIVQLLFGHRRLDTLNRLLATGESLAHLRHLELEGRIAASRTDGAVLWSRSVDEPLQADPFEFHV